MALSLAFGPGALWCAQDPHPPRPISDAERAAVEAVLAFLESGPNAVLTRLSSDSPMRAVSTSHAIDEIAVRMGPAEDSRWQLRTPGRNFEENEEIAIFAVEFASGVDDTVLMDMKRQGDGTWAIHEIRCTVDPRVPRISAEEELEQLFRGDDAATYPTPPNRFFPQLVPALLAFGLVFLVLAAIRAVHYRPRGQVAVLLTTTLILVGCQLLPDGDDEVQEELVDELDALELAPLLPLRRALTGGRTSGQQAAFQEQIGTMVKELATSLGPDDDRARAARAWQAQLLVLDGNIGAATKILDAAPKPDTLPLLAILRGRVSVALANEEAVQHYDLARRLGPDHDGLAQEAVLGVATVGEDGKVEEHVRSLIWMKSRDALGFYYSAQFEALLDQMEKAEGLFQAAWNREPMGRSELLQEPILAHIAIRPALFPLLRFVDAVEPQVGPEQAASRPLDLPERGTARILGQHLEIRLDDRVLSVLGGADLMPEGTVTESAAERADREVSSAVARFDELAASLAEGGMLRPSYRRAVETLTDSLVYSEDWDSLIRLTEPLATSPSSVPPSLIQARALALMRSDQSVAAANLLIELAKSDQANRRRDPATFYQLGEMLTELGQYDLAIRALERASSLSAFDFTAQRRQQIKLMKDLEESKKVFQSKHFRMVYPASTGERYPRQRSWVLEAEWDRVKKWIPVPAGSPKVEIHLFPFSGFMKAYARSGGLVGGLYDGVVRVPLADFESFHPELIRIVSHEVAHAMIDIATRDRAPKWFHEGLAGHIEMHQRELNPMPDMHAAGRDLTFNLLEPILAGWSEPQLVELAYTNAAWTLHYIESEKGVRGIHRMLDAFRRGHDTKGAIRKVFGTSVETFDRNFRTWAIRDAPQIWPSEMVAYHERFDDLVRRDAMEPVRSPEPRAVLQSGKERYREGELERMMRKWHAEYTAAVRPVKVSLSKALPLLQGKVEGDVQGACRELRSELDRLLGNRSHLNAPDAQVATSLRQAYSFFKDMTQHCRSRKWKSMRRDMELAVYHLGVAKDGMDPYGVQP
ncbi:MAG: hypothetical protein MPN21_01070 [Thermoanaerobaculia bacterium]|nr:hypothetical protein [Thermoanaerobaculia bacterium]